MKDFETDQSHKKEKVTENCCMFDRKKFLEEKKAMREIHEQQNQKK